MPGVILKIRGEGSSAEATKFLYFKEGTTIADLKKFMMDISQSDLENIKILIQGEALNSLPESMDLDPSLTLIRLICNEEMLKKIANLDKDLFLNIEPSEALASFNRGVNGDTKARINGAGFEPLIVAGASKIGLGSHASMRAYV